ncbi:GPO family capsid scaffolding protein [Neisseriaceae bacterium B1]
MDNEDKPISKDTPQPKHTYQTGWRIIGVSGDTVDGREIAADTLIQMAKDYNPAIYGARINIEHNSYWWNETGGLGDVLALKTEAWEQDPSKTALLAQFSVFPEMQELWDEGRKIYTSMEILPNFANTKRPYLVGLAITDSPASLGTTANFSVAQHHARAKEQTVSHYREMQTNQPQGKQMNAQTEIPAESPATTSEAKPAITFATLRQQYYVQPAPAMTEPEPNPVQALAQAQAESAELFATMLQDHEHTKAELASVKAELSALKEKLEKEAYTGKREPHTGNTAPIDQVW